MNKILLWLSITFRKCLKVLIQTKTHNYLSPTYLSNSISYYSPNRPLFSNTETISKYLNMSLTLWLAWTLPSQNYFLTSYFPLTFKTQLRCHYFQKTISNLPLQVQVWLCFLYCAPLSEHLWFHHHETMRPLQTETYLSMLS